MKTCQFCGKELKNNDVYTFEGVDMCEECFVAQTTICDECGDRIFQSDAITDEFGTVLCESCYEGDYCRCERCNRIIHCDDAHYTDVDYEEPYCDECYAEQKNIAIHRYGYKPQPIFYGNGPLFMGVELEIDKGGEYNDNAQILLDMANGLEDRMYCKHDGSLSSGFELVTHPLSLDYHRNLMPWRVVFNKAISMGYRSHNTSTCGLHIHVNRDYFGPTYEEQDEKIGRVVYFVEKNWNELVKCSRRTIDALTHWAARYATISATAKETYDKAKNNCYSRYVAVNLENNNTIEFRMFRGTLKYESFLATLQLVDEICKCANSMTDYELEMMSWSNFVSRIDVDAKPELIAYLKHKRLYVNEELIEESEDM